MKNHGLKKTRNPDETTKTHDERTSLTSGDIESLEEDLDIPEDTEQTTESGEPDIQPTDYEDHYDDAIDTYATDDLDEVYEGQIHVMGEMTPDDVVDEPITEVMPGKFTPDEETGS